MNLSKIKNLVLGLIIIFFTGCEGEQGAIGEIGPTGLNSLVNITNVAPGDSCENGGVKIDIGIDNNANGSLDSNEILSTSFVCNGVDGNTSLTTVTTEPAGDNCENGGVKIDSGVDLNRDGTLDNTEITATAYICNGIDGNNSLTKVTNEAAGINCENGGVKIDSGVDANGDGTLDDAEINATAYACNGVDGNISLVNVTDEAAGANCENSGVKIESGIDVNRNGTLDEEEITVTRFICNGIDGGFDEQIRLTIYGGSLGFGTNGPPKIWREFIDFDKRNYIGVDSIVFVPRFAADRSNNAVTVELYDLTNNRVIDNTSFSTNSTEIITVKSSNIFSDLPEQEIDLGIQISSENIVCETCGTGFFRGPIYLILYR